MGQPVSTPDPGAAAGLQNQNPFGSPQASGSSAGDQLSKFKDILESSDPNMLRQLKESLSPSVVSKLQSVFGNSEGSGVGGGSPGFDLSKIPPELIANFMAGGGRGPGQQEGPDLQQLAAQYGFPPGGPGFPSGTMAGASGAGGYAPNYDQWQPELHPLAHQTGPEMIQHFQELQQQFSTPPASDPQNQLDPLLENGRQAGTGYSLEQQQQDQSLHYFQQQQQYQDQYSNWG